MLYGNNEAMLDILVKTCFISAPEQHGEFAMSLEKAKKAVGSAKELASRVGVSPQALSQWKRVPSARVLTVERVSGINRSDLRPDLYPAELPQQHGEDAV